MKTFIIPLLLLPTLVFSQDFKVEIDEFTKDTIIKADRIGLGFNPPRIFFHFEKVKNQSETFYRLNFSINSLKEGVIEGNAISFLLSSGDVVTLKSEVPIKGQEQEDIFNKSINLPNEFDYNLKIKISEEEFSNLFKSPIKAVRVYIGQKNEDRKINSSKRLELMKSLMFLSIE